jgi:hypothetical protein
VIPCNVQFIDGSPFGGVQNSWISVGEGNETFSLENDFLIDIIHHRLVHSFSNSSNITIPAHIEILGSSCFFHCDSLISISFEPNSRLRRIESDAFFRSSLQSMVIPHTVQFIDSSAFINVISSSISIESDSEHFVIQNGFLINIIQQKLIHDFLNSSNITIPADIEIIGSSCFCGCESLLSISFESNLQLTRIESKAFSSASLQSIVIPRSVEIICSLCFVCCESLSSVTFESDSQLTRIESQAFAYSALQSILIPRSVEILCSSCFSNCEFLLSVSFEHPSHLKRIESQAFHQIKTQIVIPSTIHFIAFDAISIHLQIPVEVRDSCPELHRWHKLRKEGIAYDFRRILKFNSELVDLTAYLIDISAFEEKSVQGKISSEIYWRKNDGCIIRIKSISLSDRVETKDLVNELENEVNLYHPCIATPIGFVFPTESSESRELRIGYLLSEGDSLKEVLLTNPEWWTSTMKAKAIAGIALALQYAHSFGFVHGNLNSSKIFFDADHCVQITDFRSMSLENESVTEVGVGGFSGEEWMPQEDLFAFESLLFEIVVQDRDNPKEWRYLSKIPEFIVEMIRGIQLQDYVSFGSFTDIVGHLKKNKFRIANDVDSAEVLKFVGWVESFGI